MMPPSRLPVLRHLCSHAHRTAAVSVSAHTPPAACEQVHDVFESILDYPKFAVRVKEADVERVPDVLQAITPAQLASMQQHLARVWHRCASTRRRWQQAAHSDAPLPLPQRLPSRVQCVLSERCACHSLLGPVCMKQQWHFSLAVRAELYFTSGAPISGTHMMISRIARMPKRWQLFGLVFAPGRFRWASARYQLGLQHQLDSALASLDGGAGGGQPRPRRGGAPERLPAGGGGARGGRGGGARLQPQPFRGDVRVDDAFSTIMQW